MVARLKGRPSPIPPEDLPPDSDGLESKKSGTSKLLIAVTVLSLVGLLAAGGYIWYQSGTSPLHAPPSETGASSTAAPSHEDTTGPIKNLGPFVVNLGTLGNQHYLRISLSLDFLVRDPQFVGKNHTDREKWLTEFKTELKNIEPVLKDVVVTTLSSRSPEELNGLPGKEELKAELTARFNQHFSEKAVVHQVYFTDFVIQ